MRLLTATDQWQADLRDLWPELLLPPGKAHPDACGADGALLFVREDDKPETARRRVSVYLERTLPVTDHYRRQGLVTEIDGVGAVEEVSSRLLRGLP